MSSYELTFSPERPERNPQNGRYLKGHVPANKGKKWNDYCSKSAQRRMKKGWKNLALYRVHPDNCGRPKRPVVALSSSRILYFKCINDAATWCNGAASNIRRCCAQNSHPTGSGKAAQNTDHRYMGIRFYYESDYAIWSSKISQ